ncbi:arabinogalactan peptide [Ralstonia pseudosolanacearum]|uniref:arabinogalactan peptide n=1 Tax=Ralstonia pseudosolanacearum TaxID=1310165 RepID=UPI003CF6B533
MRSLCGKLGFLREITNPSRNFWVLKLVAMAVRRVSFGVVVMMVAVIVFSVGLNTVEGQEIAPSPAPTSDGTSIDQGVAYILMFVALVLTYLIHPLDASSSFSFF